MKKQNKSWVVGICLLVLSVALILSAGLMPPVFAGDSRPRLVDDGDLLSEREESELSDLLNEISERQQVDLVVVTVNTMDGQPAMVYADDFYDDHGYGFGDEHDGILLLVSMEEREWYISTSGYGITAITDAGREYISEKFVSDLSAGDYGAAFTSFAKLCDDFIEQARTGTPYDVGNLPGDKLGFFVGNLVLSFGAALIISLIVTGIMRGQLKTVRSKVSADDYMKQGSLQLTKTNDLFLYSHVDRRKKPETDSSNHSGSSGSSGSLSGGGGSRTHTSSSGRTHGGGGGKF